MKLVIASTLISKDNIQPSLKTPLKIIETIFHLEKTLKLCQMKTLEQELTH